MSRKEIQDRIRTIFEDIYGHKVEPVWKETIENFFDNENDLEGFSVAVTEEFDLPNMVIVETARTFYELIVLIEDELSQENY